MLDCPDGISPFRQICVPLSSANPIYYQRLASESNCPREVESASKSGKTLGMIVQSSDGHLWFLEWKFGLT